MLLKKDSKNTFSLLENHLDYLVNELFESKILDIENIKSDLFLEIINKSGFLITLHDVEFYKPICLNNKMSDFYGFDNNWLKSVDHFYYLKTIHTKTYHTLLESISFFRKDISDYLHLNYKLLYKNREWKQVIGTTKTIIRTTKGKPKFALTLAEISVSNNNFSIQNRLDSLTKREKEIIQNLSIGLSKKEIANKLYLSISTVETHTKNIYKKLNINKISELLSLTEKFTIK